MPVCLRIFLVDFFYCYHVVNEWIYICVGICNGGTIKITWRNKCVREHFLPMYIRPFPMLIKASLLEPWLKTFIKTGPLKFSINIFLLQCNRGQFCMHGIFPMVLVAKWHSISRKVETERNPLTKIVLTSFIPKLWQICLITFSQFLVWLNSEKIICLCNWGIVCLKIFSSLL